MAIPGIVKIKGQRWCIAVLKLIAELRSVTRHMGSHGITGHPTWVNAFRLNLSQTGRYSNYVLRKDGRLS